MSNSNAIGWVIGICAIGLGLPVMFCGGCAVAMTMFADHNKAKYANSHPVDVEHFKILSEAQRTVKSVLKNPDTAKFRLKVDKEDQDENIAYCSGTVTASNSFGGEIRKECHVWLLRKESRFNVVAFYFESMHVVDEKGWNKVKQYRNP